MSENFVSKFDMEVDGGTSTITVKDAGARSLVSQEIVDRSALIKTDGSGNTIITTEEKIVESAHDKETTVIDSNSTHVNGANTVNISGAHTEVYGSTYGKTVTGKNTVHYNGGSEEIHKLPVKITAPDLTLDVANGLTYGNPTKLNDYFDYVDFKSKSGNTYKMLVASDGTDKIGETGTAESLGIVAGTVSNDVRTSNTNIANTELAKGKIIIFGNDTYEFNGTLNLQYGSGLVGCGPQSKLLFYGNNDAISVNLVYNPNPQFEHDTWSSVTLTGLRIISATPNRTTGDGLHIQNYTFNVTCNKEVEKYWALKGDGYALELRNSNISYLYIVGFNRNIFLEDYCAVLTLDHIICTNGIIGMVDNSHDSLVSNMLITFADKFGINMNGNLDPHYSNIKVYQNGKAANDQTGYAGVNLNNIWGGQFSNLTSEENAGMGIQMTGCKGTVINAIASSNGYAPLSSTDIYSYAGMGLQNCEGIIGSLLAIDKHALYSSQPATQSYGFFASSPKSAQLFYAEAGNKKTIKDFDWDWMCNLHPANNDMNFNLLNADGVTITSGKGRYHDNRIDITAELQITAQVPSGNWLINMTTIDYSNLTTNFKTFDTIYATASDNAGNVYPIKVVANEAVYALKNIPAGTTLHVSVSVPITV